MKQGSTRVRCRIGKAAAWAPPSILGRDPDLPRMTTITEETVQSPRRLPATGACSLLLKVASFLMLCLPPVYREACGRTYQALPPGTTSADRRLGPLRTLNSEVPFTPVASQTQWQQRAERLRHQVLVATGLWPMPQREPLQAVVHSTVSRGDYSVSKVYFQSLPGHYVTGNLYRPLGRKCPLPAVLCPHGHWAGGRFHDHGYDQVRREIASGAERFEAGGRHPLQARCVQLARMGCVVFHYDMVGYADSGQLPHSPGAREEMNHPSEWGFFSPQAELRLQNMMGLQTYNSIRSLDFLESLEGVDPQRIAVTGASGGGTQTFILCAIDDRPAVAFPAVMVSTGMQGGCTCENACCLRIDAGNVDLAALTAPRPLGMTGADDWTREIAHKGLPDLEKLYAILDRAGLVAATVLPQYGHNYNAVSRTAMYHWLNRHLALGFDEPILERDYVPLSRDELSVWDERHPRPSGEQTGAAHEKALCRWLSNDARQQLETLVPRTAADVAAFRQVVGAACEIILGVEPRSASAAEFQLHEKHRRGDHLLMTGPVRVASTGQQLPALFLHPADDWNGQVVLWFSPQGKQGLLSPGGEPIPAASRLLAAGYSVASADLLGQGELVSTEWTGERGRLVGDEDPQKAARQYAGYTFGYNRPLFSDRVRDVLAMIDFAGHDPHKAQTIHLVGVGTAGPVVLAARAVAGDAVDKTAVETGGFRFASVTQFNDPMFLPGAVKYHDLDGLLAMCAPAPVWISGETARSMPVAAAVYGAAQSAEKVRFAESGEDFVDWLTAP